MDENMAAFLKVMDPADNTTGGGTASAVAGAMAAALVAMVARLSVGKEWLEADPFYANKAAEAQNLSHQLFAGGFEDSQAFEAVRNAYGLAKVTEEEKVARREAIHDAWITAARVPLANAERCERILELAEQLRGRSNPTARSDLKCALYLARAALLGCVENVEINLPSVKNEETAEELLARAQELREVAMAREAFLSPGT